MSFKILFLHLHLMAILARLRTLTTDTGPMNFTILFMDIITIRLVFSKCIRGGVETFFSEDSIYFTIRPRSTDPSDRGALNMRISRGLHGHKD